jgi:predicted aspartyl protease
MLVRTVLTVLVCTLAWAPSWSEAPPSSRGITVPFHYDPLLAPGIIVQASVNNGKLLPFLVDTGLSIPLLVDAAAARACDLKLNGKTAILSPGNLKVAVTDACSLRFPTATGVGRLPSGSTFHLEAARVGDLRLIRSYYAGPPIMGIIGVPILKPFTVRLDFVAQTITLFAPSQAPLAPQQAIKLAIKEREDRFFASLPLENDASVDLLLDTGSMSTDLPEETIKRFQPIGSAAYSGGGFAGQAASTLYLLSRLPLGTASEPNVEVVTSDNSPYGSVLGMNLLTRFRVMLDFPNRLMTLERAADYARRIHVSGEEDIFLERRDGHYFVKSVSPDSAPEKSGLQKGDCVVEVDGHAIDPFPEKVVKRLVDGFADTTARIRVERGDGQKADIHYVRPGRFRPSGSTELRLGLSVGLTQDNRWIVSDIAMPSVAQQAGLQTNDEIVEINGLSTQHMSLEQFGVQMRKVKETGVTLQIRRKGEDKLLAFHLRVGKRL